MVSLYKLPFGLILVVLFLVNVCWNEMNCMFCIFSEFFTVVVIGFASKLIKTGFQVVLPKHAIILSFYLSCDW